MRQSVSQKRPWLAALLAALVTGLGHLYLRRWRRAVGWLAVSFAVSLAFVDPAAVDEIVAGTIRRDVLLGVAPMFVVVGLSVIDAYVLARSQTADRPSTPGESGADVDAATADRADEESIACPNCGKELDPDLEFCHWCTTRLDRDAERDDA